MNLHSVNPLFFILFYSVFNFIVDKVDGFIEEKEGNKYLNFAFTDNNKEVLKKYAEVRNGIKNMIEKIDNR